MNPFLIRVGSSCLLSLAVLTASPVSAEVNDVICGPLRNAYGPYDYRSDKNNLPVVEAHHFTPEVESLRSGRIGRAGSGVGTDLDYTLRAFPNHPRALMSMVRFGEKERTERPRGTLYSVECYLYRAWRFKPDDGTVRLIYATYLAKHGRSSEALDHLNDAISLGESNANLYYNIGLVYFDLKDYDQALTYAHKSYVMGFPLPGLRDKLKKVGRWREPEPVSEEGVPPTEATAASEPAK